MNQGSLTELLGSSSATSLFSGAPFQPAKPVIQTQIEPKEKHEKKHNIKKNSGPPEEDRLIFVGNVSLQCKKSKIKKIMSAYGEVETVWRRSIPLDRGKLPITAAVALKMVKII